MVSIGNAAAVYYLDRDRREFRWWAKRIGDLYVLGLIELDPALHEAVFHVKHGRP
jgi:hypothetical protein